MHAEGATLDEIAAVEGVRHEAVRHVIRQARRRDILAGRKVSGTQTEASLSNSIEEISGCLKGCFSVVCRSPMDVME